MDKDKVISHRMYVENLEERKQVVKELKSLRPEMFNIRVRDGVVNWDQKVD